jgi:hypothetical protein
MINAYWKDLTFIIHEGRPDEWSRVVDTGLAYPNDFADAEGGFPIAGLQYPVKARSIVVLER